MRRRIRDSSRQDSIEYVVAKGFRSEYEKSKGYEEFIKDIKRLKDELISDELISDIINRHHINFTIMMLVHFPDQFSDQDYVNVFKDAISKEDKEVKPSLFDQLLNELLKRKKVILMLQKRDFEHDFKRHAKAFNRFFSTLQGESESESDLFFEVLEFYIKTMNFAESTVKLINKYQKELSLEFYEDMFDYLQKNTTSKHLIRILLQVAELKNVMSELLAERLDLLLWVVPETLTDPDSFPELHEAMLNHLARDHLISEHQLLNYYLSMYEFNSKIPHVERAIEYLFGAGEIEDAPQLRTKLFQEKYLEQGLDVEIGTLNYDLATLLFLLDFSI